LGFNRKISSAVHAAHQLAKTSRVASNKNNPAATQQAADGIEPANPLRHNPSLAANGAINKCGSGSHGTPSCSQPGVLLSTRRRA
jgi:hypothetical protein